VLQTSKHQVASRLDQAREDLVLAIQNRSINSVYSTMTSILDQLDPARDTLHMRYLQRVSTLIALHGFTEVARWKDTELEELIAKGAFIDHEGNVLFVAPAGPRRNGSAYCLELTAIYGHCQQVSVSVGGSPRVLFEGLITDEQFDSVAFVPIIPKRASGLLAGSTDEYFIPGTFWRIGTEQRALRVPALLNVEAVRLAAEGMGKYLVYELFDSKSAHALTDWLEDPSRARRLIALEYFKHECGHASSQAMIQLAGSEPYKRDRARRLETFAHDESRADGSSQAEFCKRYISGSDEERDIYAVTIMVRILDLARVVKRGDADNIPLDVDALTALKWWEQLTLGGTLYKHRKGGKLALAQQYAYAHGAINTDESMCEVNMAHVVWPMQTWASRAEENEKLCSDQFSLSAIVRCNQVGARIRDLFVRDLLKPISTITLGVKS
jgi:hypothetical protein